MGRFGLHFAILAALSETQTAAARSQDLSRSIYIRELDAAISFNEVVACDGFFPLKDRVGNRPF